MKKLVFLTVGILLLAFLYFENISTKSATVEEWGMLRKNQFHDGRTNEELMPPLSLKWKVRVDDGRTDNGLLLMDSALVGAGKVFTLGREKGESSNTLYAFDLIAGKLVWKQKGIGNTFPALGGNKIIVFLNGVISALDLKRGKVLWKGSVYNPGGTADLTGKSDPYAFTLADGIVYFLDRYGLHAVKEKDGSTFWDLKLDDTDGGLPLRGAVTIINKWAVFNVQHWRYQLALPSLSPKYKFYADSIGTVPCSNTHSFSTGYFSGLSVDILDKSIKGTTNSWKYKYISNAFPPVIGDELVYTYLLLGKFPGGTPSPYLLAVNAKDGRQVWHWAMEMNSAPVLSKGTLYATGINYIKKKGFKKQIGSIYAFDALTGKVLWSFKNKTDIFYSPVVANGKLFVRSSNGFLYAFSQANSK